MDDSSERDRKFRKDIFSIEEELDDNLFMSDFGKPSIGKAVLNIDGLNKEQAEMVNNINLFLLGKFDVPYFLVQGSGGTGKSYTIRRAIANIPDDAIISAAPSHFAKNVLQNFLGEDYNVTTVASLLGKKVTYDKDTGKEILVKIKGKLPPIIEYSYILIDEVSMLDQETYDEIMGYVRAGNKKLIVLGDYCQLPPVNQQEDSPFFDIISAELVTPMRFTGPIYDLAMFVRTEIVNIRHDLIPTLNVLNIKTDRISNINEVGSGYIFLNNIGTLLRAAIRRFKMGKGPNYARIVAYRNKTIDKINHHIRQGLYGDTLVQFEKGELLINNGGYSIRKGRKVISIISNGDIFEVSHAEDTIGPYDIKCKALYFKDKHFNVPILAVATEGKPDYDKIKNRLKEKALSYPSYWKDYYAFIASFADFSYNYACSSHKVQGSSIKHVYVLEDDIYSVKPTSAKEKLQSLYVSITRAAFRVYVYNKDSTIDNTQFDKSYLKFDYDG